MSLQEPVWLIYGFAALAGLCVGSFAGLLAYRLPRGMPVVAGRSCCATCGRTLSLGELAPLLSYALQRGRCKQCGAPVSWRYPFIELTAAVLSVFAVWVAGAGPDAALLALLAIGLLIIIFVDLEFLIIPDTVLIALALFGAAYRAPDWMDAAIGMAVGGALAWLLRYGFFRMRKREALGLGDVKFFAMAGIWTGLGGLAGFLLLSGFFGILVALAWRARGGGAEFPFGPALALGLFSVVILARFGLTY